MGVDPGPAPEEGLVVPPASGRVALLIAHALVRRTAGSDLLLVNTVKYVSERTSSMSPAGTPGRAMTKRAAESQHQRGLVSRNPRQRGLQSRRLSLECGQALAVLVHHLWLRA